MSSSAPFEAMTAVQDDVRPEELHCSFRSGPADACSNYQGSHHNNELKDLIKLRVTTHEFNQETTTGLEYRPSQDRPPENNIQDMITKTSNDMHLPVHASENSDPYSLRSSTQPTDSSALSKSAPSSTADSSSKTVSTAPTSIISCSSGVNGIREVEKGVFAAPRMTLEPQDRLAWDKIQPKLQDTIFNTFRPRKDLDDTISCEFMMGGPSPTRLTPTVFLVCCHELYRKQLRSILKRQKWMRAYKYQCVVIVDTLEDLSLMNSGNTGGNTKLLIKAFVPSGHTSWCGLKARAHSGVDQQPITFTIGGILLIDGEAFALTVKHGIERLISVDATSSSDSDDDDDAKEESSSPFINFQDAESIQTQDHEETEELTSVFESQVMAPQSCTSLVDNAAPERSYSGSGWRHFGQYNASDTVGSTISLGRLDWSLLKVELRSEISTSSLVNTLVTPTRDRIEIKSFLDRPGMTGGEVWINAGLSGLVKGWLIDRPALLHRYGRSFEVLQVIPDQPLAPGDSGSWVLRADVLCGHVLAARKSVPWLYVLPISEILDEAKAIMSCQDINLPKHYAQIDVPVVAKKNTGFSYRESTIGNIRTATLTNCDNTSQRHGPPVYPQARPSHDYVAEIMRACLGALYRERVGCPRLDYTAFANHCRSRLEDCKAATYLPEQNASCNEDVRDILQMIKTGLHRDELLDTLEQRTGPAPLSHRRFVHERIDRVASLLVMIDIGNITQNKCRVPVLWRSGTLQHFINTRLIRERVLSDSSFRLEQIFTAKSLVQIAGMRIFWTANLSDHLWLDREQDILHIFHHATYLECQRRSLESLLPDGLADETLTTLALLFPFSSSSTVPSWLRKSVVSDPEHDGFLHAIRTSPLEPREREIRNFHYWHDRIVVLKEAFDEAPGTNSLAQLWHDRRNSRRWLTFWSALLFGILVVSLGIVQVVLAGIQLRNSTHVSTVAAGGPYFTALSSKETTSLPTSITPKVEIIGLNSIPWYAADPSKETTSLPTSITPKVEIIGLDSILWYAADPSKETTSLPTSTTPKVEETGHSVSPWYTVSSSKAIPLLLALSCSKAEERSYYNISPGAIAGITTGGVTLLIMVLGVSLYLLRRRLRQRTQQRTLLGIRRREELEKAYRRHPVYSL